MSGSRKSFTFTWYIENISSFILGKNRYFRSASFTTPSGEEFELEFFTGISEASPFSFGLQRKTAPLGASHLDFVPNCNLSILTKYGHTEKYVSENGYPISGEKKHLFQPLDKVVVQCRMPNDVPQKCYARTVFLRENFRWILQQSDITNNIKMFKLGNTEFSMRINNYDLCGRVHAKLERVQDNGEKFRFPLCKISAIAADGSVSEVLCEDFHLKEPLHIVIPSVATLVLNGMIILQWEFVIALEETLNDVKGLNKNCLNSDLFQMYKDGKFCDAKLNAGGVSFPVHKCILSARSPVFCAMFERYTEEGQTGEVDITDVDKDTLNRMIVFLYTDTLKVPHPTLGEVHFKEASDLYYAADKYAILSLRDQCRSVLLSELTFLNICEVLSLADTHHDDQLLKNASIFLWETHQAVIISPQWSHLEEKKPELTNKLLKDMNIKK